MHNYLNKEELLEWLKTEYWVAEEAKELEQLTFILKLDETIRSGYFTEVDGPNTFKD
ncbi:hypothetical protein D3C78_1382740 [compost metagenome]